MDANTFVTKFRFLQPSIADYKLIDVSSDFMENDRAGFEINKVKDSNHKYELLKLTDAYDLSKTNIGGMKFFKPIRHNEKYIIGELEGFDKIVLDENDVVQVMDGDTSDVIFYCSDNSRSFLDILYTLAEYFTKCMINEDFYNSDKERDKCFSDCMKLVGNNSKFKPFYEHLLIL